MLEHAFCPRFTYFEHVLTIPERQELRFKVQKGREVHEKVQSINAAYLRKRIGCVERKKQVHLSTEEGLIGVVDEVLTLNDGTMAPLDYKFAEFKGNVWDSHRLQVAFYACLIERSYGKMVNRGFVVYTRSKNKLVEVAVGDEEKVLLLKTVQEVRTILAEGLLPPKGGSRNSCKDCCYKNICDWGLE